MIEKVLRVVLVALGLVVITASVRSSKIEVYVPRECITDIQLDDNTECILDANKHLLHCKDVKVTYTAKCERIRVIK
jgi:hypothetical protein